MDLLQIQEMALLSFGKLLIPRFSYFFFFLLLLPVSFEIQLSLVCIKELELHVDFLLTFVVEFHWYAHFFY